MIWHPIPFPLPVLVSFALAITCAGVLLSSRSPSQDDHDVLLLEHYGMSEIVTINVHTGQKVKIGPKRMYIE